MLIKELMEHRADSRIINDWLKKNVAGNFYINDNDTVDVHGHINISFDNSKKFPVKFGYVVGGFHCNGNSLKTLEGCPSKVTEIFDCSRNKLTSLKSGPASVGETYICGENPITSLEFVAREIGGDLFIMETQISSFHDIHKHIDSIGGHIGVSHSQELTDSFLGLLKIKNLKGITVYGVVVKKAKKHANMMNAIRIVNKHLPEGDIIACQQELIEAGLDNYAKL